MGVLQWINRRVENNAPAVAGGVAYGTAYLNPFGSKEDARRAADRARNATQRAMQVTAPVRNGVATAADAVVVQSARGAVRLADRATGGLVAGPAARAYAQAEALYDKASVMAPILTLDNQTRSYGEMFNGKPALDAASVAARGVTREQFLNQPKGPEALRLADRLQGEGNFLAESGYASLVELNRRRGATGVEEAAGILNRYLDQSPKSLEEKRRLAANGLRDVAFPSLIEQGPKENCGGIAVQQIWARQNPTGYLDALTRLADNRPYGLPGGEVLAPFNVARDDRQPSVRVLSDALTRHMHEHCLTRQAGLDAARAASNRILHRPLGTTKMDNYHPETQPTGLTNAIEMAQMLTQVTGRPYSWHTNGAEGRMARQLDHGRPVATLISGKATGGWHWVTATERRGERVNLSTWGSEYETSRAHLNGFLRIVVTEDR